jgi:hypothetical protein
MRGLIYFLISDNIWILFVTNPYVFLTYRMEILVRIINKNETIWIEVLLFSLSLSLKDTTSKKYYNFNL